MLGAFIVTRQRRNYCIIHFQLEGCSNVHNAAANPNTLPSLTSAGSLKPITSSAGIVHHCAPFALSVHTADCNHQIHHFFYQLYIYLAEVIIS